VPAVQRLAIASTLSRRTRARPDLAVVGSTISRVSPRFPRVEQALGVGPLLDEDNDRLWEALDRATVNQVSEGSDLDFKKQWYALDISQNKMELAKDCAAFANAGGGVLIIGIEEDGNGNAHTVTPIGPFAERERVLSILASKTEPTVDVLIREIRDPANAQHRAVFLLVPPSTLAPHQVAYNQNNSKERWGYPFRRGTCTEWMTEAEIANRYRDRFALARRQIDRADQVMQVGQRALNRVSIAWLTVTLIPAVPGSMPMSETTVASVQRTAQDTVRKKLWLNVTSPSQPLIGRPRRGRVSLFCDTAELQYGNPISEPLSDQLHMDAYLSGDGFAAQSAGSLMGGETGRTVLDQWEVEVGLVNLLNLLVQHAAITGASGDSAVLASLMPAWTDESLDSLVSTSDLARVGISHHTYLPLNIRRYSLQTASTPTGPGRRTENDPVAATVPLTAVAGKTTELVSAAAHLAADLLADDGIADLEVLTTPGAIRLPASLSHSVKRRGKEWADSRGVPVT